jgi:SAM-dependent methyltransferase
LHQLWPWPLLNSNIARLQVGLRSARYNPASGAAAPSRRLLKVSYAAFEMNAQHLKFCSSAEWAEFVEDVLLPWVVDGHQLGQEVLEVGAGPGLVTDALRQRVPRLVAVEVDQQLAAALGRRLSGSGVQVVQADATALPFHSHRFSAVACFTMLHHVPTVAMQDRMLREFCRVLRPGGILVGTDGMDTPSRRELHVGDVFLPVPPDRLPGRLRPAGFTDPDVEVDVGGDRFRFVATSPG